MKGVKGWVGFWAASSKAVQLKALDTLDTFIDLGLSLERLPIKMGDTSNIFLTTQCEPPMYIIPIAWMYVVVLMAATESSVLASVSTLFLYGVFPCSILMYILTAPRRAQLRRARESLDQLPEPTQTNQHSSDPNSVTPPAQSPSQNAPKAD